jgi:hypothetical protein
MNKSLPLVIITISLLTIPTMAIAANPSQFVAGTCKSLNAKGWGNFPKGDPNYSSNRDRDKDGIAC